MGPVLVRALCCSATPHSVTDRTDKRLVPRHRSAGPAFSPSPPPRLLLPPVCPPWWTALVLPSALVLILALPPPFGLPTSPASAPSPSMAGNLRQLHCSPSTTGDSGGDGSGVPDLRLSATTFTRNGGQW